MSNNKSPLLVILLFFTLLIAACSEEESTSGNNDVGNTDQLNSGGTVSAPAQMSYVISNEINSDAVVNYFSAAASMGDTIIINTTLTNPLDGSDDLRCQLTGDYFISNSTGYEYCGAHVWGVFGSDGDRIYNFKFPFNNGYYDAAYIPEGTTFSPSFEASGRPDEPRSILLGSIDNQLSANSFYNNFVYDAQAGETLKIQTYPEIVPSGTDNLACQNSGQWFQSYYSYGVLMFDVANSFNCSETFEYTFTEAGQYKLNIRFLPGVKGYFQAVVN